MSQFSARVVNTEGLKQWIHAPQLRSTKKSAQQIKKYKQSSFDLCTVFVIVVDTKAIGS